MSQFAVGAAVRCVLNEVYAMRPDGGTSSRPKILSLTVDKTYVVEPNNIIHPRYVYVKDDNGEVNLFPDMCFTQHTM